MPILLRQVEHRRWYTAQQNASDPLPACALSDLKADISNALSLWEILDDRSNLELVATNLAAGRSKLVELEYVLIEQGQIEQLGIRVVETRARNALIPSVAGYHRDAISLTAADAVAIAELFRVSGEFDDVPDTNVGRILAREIEAGTLKRSSLQSSQSSLESDLVKRGFLAPIP